MALNSLGLGFVFTAKDLASGTMRKVEGRFHSLDTTTAASTKAMRANMQKAVAGLGVMAAGALATAGAFKLASDYGTFEKGLAKVGAITRATDDELQALKATALQAGIDTQFSPDEAIAGLGELGVRGFTTKEAIDALSGSLDLAAGGEISIAQASSTTASALRVFGLQADQATEAADKLLKISNLTALQANDLELALGNVARGAGPAKQSLDEMLISVGLVRNSGVAASVASSSVSSALLAIAKNKDKFKEMGIAVADSNGEFLDFGNIVLNAKEKLDQIPSAVDRVAAQKDLFTKFGLTAYNAVATQLGNGVRDATGAIVKGEEALAHLRREMEASSGTAAKFREQLLDTFEGQKTLLRGSMQTLRIALGEAFAKALKPVVSAIIGGVNAIIKLINAIPAPLKKAIAAGFLLVSVLVALAGAVMAGAAAFAMIQSAVIAFAGPLLVAGQVLLGVVAAATAVVVVFRLLKKAFDENLGGFGTKLRIVYGRVKLFFDAVRQLLSGDGRLRGDVLSKLLDPANRGVLTMVQRFQQARHRAQEFVQGVKDGFMIVWRTLGPVFSALGDAVNDLAKEFGFGQDGLGLFTSKGEDFRSTGEMIGEILGEVARILLNAVVIGINAAVTAVRIFKVAWEVLGPLLAVSAKLLWHIFRAVGPLIAVIGDLVQGLATATGGAGKWAMALMGVTAAIAYVFPALGAFAAAILGPVGFVAAAAAAGLAVGTFLDQRFGLSDMLSEWALEITGVTDELNKLDEAYRKTIKTRGQVATFGDLEEAAKAQGMSVTKYADMRAKEIAGQETAQRLGLSENEIKQRLLSGTDVYAELNAPGPEAAGGGIEAQNDGSVKKGDAQAKATGDALAEALDRAGAASGESTGGPKQAKFTLNVDKAKVAEMVRQANMDTGALDFEADFGALGSF